MILFCCNFLKESYQIKNERMKWMNKEDIKQSKIECQDFQICMPREILLDFHATPFETR